MDFDGNRDRRLLRIGCASAFWGDTEAAAAQLVEKGQLDVLVFDYLSEITLSIMAGQRLSDPGAGFARDFVDVLAPLLPAIKAQGLRVISNAGGINPLACRDALLAAAARAGVELRIAVVLGDDILARLPEWRNEIREWQTGAELPAMVLSANAYLGALPIRAALDEGAEIVITGRCVDSAVTLAPLMHYFGWRESDYDLLAAGALAGHLIECGAQATGGNFTDWQTVPGYADMGFPIVEVRADGQFTLTKPENTGGLVTPATVAEQLVYEIGDPARYVLPDVVCDFSAVRLHQAGPDRVEVSGARGLPPTPTYKVSATYPDGFRCTALFMIGGIDADTKGRHVADALMTRISALLAHKGFPPFRRHDIEVLGSEASYGPHSRTRGTREVVVKIGVHHDDKRALVLFSREIAQAATAMAPGITGYAGGRPIVHPMVRLYSFLLAKDRVAVSIDMAGKSHPVSIPGGTATPLVQAPHIGPSDHDDLPDLTEAPEVPLIRLAYARSGDKGDDANIGVIARQPDYLPLLRAALSEHRVARYFAHLGVTQVARYEWPGIHALNFVLSHALGGGGVASLRMDPQGKALAQMLLDIPIPVPKSLFPTLALPH